MAIYNMIKKPTKQTNLLGSQDYPTYEEIIADFAKEFKNYIFVDGVNVFGFWMQTLADLALLELELKGLVESYKIDPINRSVILEGDLERVRTRIAHLERVDNKPTLYSEIVDLYGDTNAYAFHNLYPFKGKFYPRVVRTLINAFNLDSNAIILDPFNGSGTTTHEASLMNIKSVGIDITPIGTILAELKNELPFMRREEIIFNIGELTDIFNKIEHKEWQYNNNTIYKLMLILYFDTIDAFTRTTRYKKQGKLGLFIKKYHYIIDCYDKLMLIKQKYNLNFARATIKEGDILKLKEYKQFKDHFDAIITSPPYYFSIDYVGKDEIAYSHLNINMNNIKNKYLGMKNNGKSTSKGLPHKIIRYYEDLKISIQNMYWALKSNGKCAIIIGDSMVKKQKIPTTMMTKRFCEEVGFKVESLIFNPLLGARNRAIRGESIIICTKQ